MFESSMSTLWSRPLNFFLATILSPPTHAIPFPHPPIRGSVQLWQLMILSSLENWPLLAFCGDYSWLHTCPVDVKTKESFTLFHSLNMRSTLLILFVPIEDMFGCYIPIYCLWWQLSSFKATWHLLFYVFCSHRLRRELKVRTTSMLEAFFVCTIILIWGKSLITYPLRLQILKNSCKILLVYSSIFVTIN